MRTTLTLSLTALLLVLLSRPADAGYEEGEQALRRGDLSAARSLWREPARAGDARAQLGLGRLLLAHANVEGLSWIRKSADGGHLPAQVRMAALCRDGLYVPKDAQRSVAWLKKALGHEQAVERQHAVEASYARVWLAQAYEAGEGVTKDNEKRIALLRRAADAGNDAAQYAYASLLESGKLVAKDFVEAHKYFVLSWKQLYELRFMGMTMDTARARALAIRKRMTPAQMKVSRQRVRAWLDDQKAGKLGQVFDYRKRGGRGALMLERDEDQELYVFGLTRILASDKDCEKPLWLRSRKVIRGRSGVSPWKERWTLDVCGRGKPVEMSLSRRRDGTLVASFSRKTRG